MGTHAVTHVKDHTGKTVCSLLRTAGGHPSEHGRQLAAILSRFDPEWAPAEHLAAKCVGELDLICDVSFCDPFETGDYTYDVRISDTGINIEVRNENNSAWTTHKVCVFDGRVVGKLLDTE